MCDVPKITKSDPPATLRWRVGHLAKYTFSALFELPAASEARGEVPPSRIHLWGAVMSSRTIVAAVTNSSSTLRDGSGAAHRPPKLEMGAVLDRVLDHGSRILLNPHPPSESHANLAYKTHLSHRGPPQNATFLINKRFEHEDGRISSSHALST